MNRQTVLYVNVTKYERGNRVIRLVEKTENIERKKEDDIGQKRDEMKGKMFLNCVERQI